MQKRGGRVLQRQNYLESNYLTFLEKRGCAFMYPTAGHSSGNPRCPGTPPRPGKQCYPPAHRAQACSRHRVPRHGIPPAQHPAGRSCLHPQGAGATSCSSLPAPSHKTPPKQAAGLLQRSTHARAAGFPLPTLSLCQGENFFFLMETFSAKGHITGSVAIFQPTSSSLHFPIVFLPVAFSPLPSLPHRTRAGIPHHGLPSHNQGFWGEHQLLPIDNHSYPPKQHVPKAFLGTADVFLHGRYHGQPLPIPAHGASLWQLLQPLAQKKLFIHLPRTRVGADSSKPALRRLSRFTDYRFRNFSS